MVERKNFSEIVESVYSFLKEHKTKEFSINHIAKEVKTRWDTTTKALELLKCLSLIYERKTGAHKTSTRFFKFRG